MSRQRREAPGAPERRSPHRCATIKNGDIKRGYMGISTVDVTAAMQTAFSLPVDHGVGIVQVTSGSPADAAVLQVNDIIVSVAGTTINNSGDLLHVLQQHRSGDTVDVSYYRGSNQQSTKVTLGTNPSG